MRLIRFVVPYALPFVTAVILLTAEANKNENPVKPAVLWTGPQSHIIERKFVRIKSQEHWTQVWLEHLGKNANQAFADCDTQYQIDFERFEVIGVFQGAGWNSRGIRFLDFEEADDTIRIRYEDISYQTSGIDGGGEKVSAYAFLVYPKTRKAYRLQENTQGLKNQPSKWTDRATL